MSPELLSNVRKGIRLMHDYAESLGMPEIEADVTVYVYRDIDKLVDAHHEVTGEPKNDIPQIPHLTLLRAVSCAFRGVRVSTWIDA